ncbi:MAG TPA: valine--tRNA ligase [Thermodesulfovibrionales bacterium]|nr:valine--tRNA ligase [Thermodesulfovibrionales bacterium]
MSTGSSFPVMTKLAKHYNLEGVEEKWYAFWFEKGYFKPRPGAGEPYAIVIPPPNVTGSLHMGHALNATLQDILIRWKRMSGYKALWIPGTDHAGIATQNVVERDLAREKLDRYALGRDAFIDRVWKWKAEYGGRITHQLRRLGASCDWSRERFTLDEGLSKAVREVFVRLYEEGLIYRDKRLINWCPRCHTALSDLEVEHEEIEGLLTYIRYPLSGGAGHVVVATTRPETMLGDTAVAVNPDDRRYTGIVGKSIDLPLTDRKIPVIADSAVDPSFGTGAVKVTPAHDFNDEAMARRQSPPLSFITVIGDNGKMTREAGGKYAGLDRYACRKKVVEDLKSYGLMEKEEKHGHSVGHCYRCKTIIEPLSTPQWYVNTKPLAAVAMAAVREGKIKITPPSWENTYFSWMENIRDWCISRQIWWGHRIPVWYCDACSEIIVSRETPISCSKCGGSTLRQDEDVLDTWFSSALWPFSTLGWPEKTEDLGTFYPTSVLVTAFDILFFWVARMIMMGLKFMDAVPFRDVYIHALVRDAKGEKMSKSKGNVVDPLVMIEKYGTDAFRFTLAAFAAQGRDVRFSEERVEGYRYFVNKLWNAARFIAMNTESVPDHELEAIFKEKRPLLGGENASLDLPSRWILSRLSMTVEEMNGALGEYRFNDAANSIYQFVWHEFCDWYIEMAKHAIYEKSEYGVGTIACLISVLDHALRLLHPFMPFVTEEIWQTIRQTVADSAESIAISHYPEGLPRDIQAEEEMLYIMDAVGGIRNIRGELNIAPSAEVTVLIRTFSEGTDKILVNNIPLIKRLARAGEITVGRDVGKPKGCATGVRDLFQIYVPVEGLLNIEEEIARLTKEKLKVAESLGFLDKKLLSEDFLKRAPQNVVEKERVRYQELVLKDERLAGSIKRLQEMGVKHG